MTLTCSVTQREMIRQHHEWLCAHNGVDRTLALMTQRHPEETSTAQWPQLRHDVREYIQSCATCQKMEVRHKSIRASHFVLSTLKPMQRIALDTIGPMDISMDFRYIIVVIDTFTRYVELFPANDVTAAAATDALWRHFCRFGTPLEIVTAQGSQFMNQTLQGFATLTGVRHHGTIPYSKEENGIVERANKEINRHIRNILADKALVENWPQMLCMTEKLLNSSVKKPLGASPNTLLFGNSINQEPVEIKDMDQQNNTVTPKSIREYVDKFMHRQSKLFVAAAKSQQETNEEHLKRRYANYKTKPRLRQRTIAKANDFSDIDHDCVTAPSPIAHIWVEPRPLQPAILAAQKWIKDPANGEYIRMVEAGQQEIIDSVQEIDLSPYVDTTYQVGDYVLRRYPATKAGQGNPNKYGSWWRGPYLVTAAQQVPIVYGYRKTWYTITNLVTTREYFADITHLKPFYYDPDFVTPLNIAVRDSEESVVSEIVEHDFSDPTNKLWLVKWLVDEPPGGTWENRETLKDVEAFHHYCAAHKLNAFLPRAHPLWEASMPKAQRRTAAQWKVPEPPQDATKQVTVPGAEKKKRGRPVTKPATGLDSAEVDGKQQATRRRGRPKKNAHKDVGTEQEEEALIRSADDGGQETVTTMVNYMAPTTWWKPADEKEADTGIGSGDISVVPQPEDA